MKDRLQDDFLTKLKEAKNKYISNLPAKISEIKFLWSQLNKVEWRSAMLENMRNQAHNLAGSGGTFGFPNLSEQAKLLELQLYNLTKNGDVKPTDAEIAKVEDILIALQEVELETIRESESPSTLLNQSDIIFVLDEDKESSLGIARQLMYYGCNVKTLSDPAQLEKQLKVMNPLLIIIDSDFAKKQMNDRSVIDTLRKDWVLTCPIVIISHHDDFDTRMDAIKNNASAFFTKPMDTSLLAERINIITNANLLEPYRILIVEDDEELANFYALTLEKGGMKVFVENKPENALNKIMQLNPELVVMDLYMPNYNGIDLVKMIRQHQALFTLPIVLLTSERDVNVQFLAREVGVDDFLFKPIEPDHLYDAVLNRVQRSRYMNVSMSKDSLTGLFVHKKILEYLKMQLNVCMRYNRSLTYVILDIDNFKSINDTYGHLIGDNVLIALSNILKSGVRSSDFVGRYGGEEFVIIYPETQANEALISIERLRKKFAETEHFAGDRSFKATFSAGIACFPKFGDMDEIMAKADEALYASKQNGKNKTTNA
jgi:diguanylate cyclase (GGDEF)-like protein